MNKQSQHNTEVKKPKKRPRNDHSGSWKITYADFMTAMMALFLVIWLILSITAEQRHQLAEFFTASSTNINPSTGKKSSESDSAIAMDAGDIIKQDAKLLSHQVPSDAETFDLLQENIAKLINTDPRLNHCKSNLLFTINDSGLLIQIIDSQDRAMFMLGSKKPEAHMIGILQALVPLLNEIPSRLTLTGHTDSLPFANAEIGYSHWELSVDRANAARQVLLTGGLDKDKVLQVSGVASTMAVDDKDPQQPINRRISLLILNKSKAKEVFQNSELIRDKRDDTRFKLLNENIIMTEGSGSGEERDSG